MSLSDIKGNERVTEVYLALLDPISRIASDADFYSSLKMEQPVDDMRAASIGIVAKLLKPTIMKHQKDFAEIFAIIDGDGKTAEDYIPDTWDDIASFAFRAIEVIKDPVFLNFLR